MEHNVIFVMSLSGTMVYILYLVLYPFSRKYFPVKWRLWILRISLMFFLLPIPYYRYVIERVLELLFPFLASEDGKSGSYLIGNINTIIIRADTYYISEDIKAMLLIEIVFGMISFGIIFFQMIQYMRVKNLYLKDSSHMIWDSHFTNINKVREKIKYRRSVKIVVSQACSTPLVLGVFSPRIVLPAFDGLQLKDEEWDYIIGHEFIHIKNRHLFLKFLGLFTMALHWFNPICYFVFREISHVSELCCDAELCEKLSPLQQKAYYNLMIDLATENNCSRGTMFSVGLVNDNYQMMERRILEMKLMNKRKKRFLSYVTGALIFILGGSTVFAYETPTIVEYDLEKGEFNLHQEEEFNLHPEGEFVAGDKKDPEESIPFERYFTDKDGNIYEATNLEQKAGCVHSYVSGEYKEHNRKSDGSCVMSYYDANRCTKCGYVKILNGNKTEIYNKCPH